MIDPTQIPDEAVEAAMTDIVERLRRGEGCAEEGGKTCIDMSAEGGCICAIAADEIERLRADLAFADAQCAKVESLLLGTHKQMERLTAAIAWIEPPFVNENTPELELRQRIKFCIADANRAALTQEPRT